MTQITGNIPFSCDWSKKNPSNILVRMPNWLGDAVMATPILSDLRTRYPGAKITIMCQSNVAQLFTHDQNINEIFSFKKPSGWIHRLHHLELIDSIKKGKYDLGVLLTNSFSSAWWFWRGGVENRMGFESGFRRFLLNKSVPFPETRESEHLVITYKKLLLPLGVPVSNTPPKLYVDPLEIQSAKELLKNYGVIWGKDEIIGINPGSAYGEAKCWLPERFSEVTKKLIEDPKRKVLFFGDAQGLPLVSSICDSFSDQVVNLCNKTSLRQLMALIQCCSVFLTNDSGPMHLAAALGTPLLALFGSTSEVKTGPYNGGQIIHKHVSCSPCYKRVCPIKNELKFRCMKEITAEEVYQRLLTLLKK